MEILYAIFKIVILLFIIGLCVYLAGVIVALIVTFILISAAASVANS